MTGRPIKMALTRSVNWVSFGFPYGGPQRAVLVLRKHPRAGQDVMLAIERGQFLCRPFDGCTILVRFDGGKATEWGAKEPADYTSTVLFFKSPRGFITKLRGAKTITSATQFFQEGERVFTFSVGGLVW